MSSSFFINMSASHLFLSKEYSEEQRYSYKGYTNNYTNKLVERGTKTLQIAICLKKNCQREKLIIVVAWATLITNSTLWHKASAHLPREKESASGRSEKGSGTCCQSWSGSPFGSLVLKNTVLVTQVASIMNLSDLYQWSGKTWSAY